MTVAAQPPALSEGDRIAGDLEVVAHLHRSRLLDVYDVHSDSRDCRCVAKVPRPDRLADAHARERVLSEGRLLLSLAHPHVVRAYELVEEPDPVLVLEALSGDTVGRVLARTTQPLSLHDLAHLGMHLCSALHYLHGRGIVHLDLKPQNVVIDRGMAKLIDLSIARPPGPIRAGTGSRRYMAPEQARGGEVGPPADVWGAGCLLYEAATGRRAFGAREDGYEQLERRPDPVGRSMPRDVSSVIDAALDPDPAARPTVEDLADTLDDALPD